MSDCNVCIGGGESDGHFDFYNKTNPKARKAHKCSECRRLIEIGQTYERAVMKWEGDLETFKTCSDCVQIRSGLSCGEGVEYTNLWQEVYDYVFPNMTQACIDKVNTVSAKKYLQDRWITWKGLAKQ